MTSAATRTLAMIRRRGPLMASTIAEALFPGKPQAVNFILGKDLRGQVEPVTSRVGRRTVTRWKSVDITP